jgi:prepilin-type N-terminal cleavage/methylation domain-containing protein
VWPALCGSFSYFKNNTETYQMRKQKGFSLIELLIVVAIILIIAAIAIPNLLRSRMAANEASAVGSIRTLNTAEVTYASTYPTTGFTGTLVNLGGTPAQCAAPGPTFACIIDVVLAAGTKSGYSVNVAATAASGNTINTNFMSTAIPLTAGTTGTRAFCGIESGLIYYNPGASAPATEAACYTTPFVPLQ